MNVLVECAVYRMVKRYYCDTCDASYPYSVEARKKHSHGHFHQKLKKLHYDKLKTAKEKLKDELQKDKCRNFHTLKRCHFGESCIYSHLTTADIDKLQQDANREEENIRQLKLPTFVKQGKDPPSVEEWKSKLDGQDGKSSTQTDMIQEFEIKYKLPDCLKQFSNIPPSLIPPKVESLLSCSIQDWG